MKPTREHLWDAIANVPGLTFTTASYLLHSISTFQTTINIELCFYNNPWAFLTTPHEVFSMDLALIGMNPDTSSFHPCYFP